MTTFVIRARIVRARYLPWLELNNFLNPSLPIDLKLRWLENARLL